MGEKGVKNKWNNKKREKKYNFKKYRYKMMKKDSRNKENGEIIYREKQRRGEIKRIINWSGRKKKDRKQKVWM